jgi:N-acetylmuramoyl-L-alanine amidase
VVIDPGHGGIDEGARGPSGLKEKDVVLDIATRMATHLRRRGCTVTLTRKDDSAVSTTERARIANAARARALVSIHANSFRDPAVDGVETWIADTARVSSSVRRASASLAKALQKAVVRRTRLRDRGVRKGRYVILRSSKVPTALVELGFMSNPRTERRLASARWREALARALAKAVARECGLKEAAAPKATKKHAVVRAPEQKTTRRAPSRK